MLMTVTDSSSVGYFNYISQRDGPKSQSGFCSLQKAQWQAGSLAMMGPFCAREW